MPKPRSCHRTGISPPRRNRISFALTSLIACFSLAVSIAAAAPQPGRFKNLQVLPEESSTSEVFEVMKLITRALGTDCSACHLTAERNYDSDELTLKVTARAMMLLEQARREQLSWRDPPATLCFECHQGQLRPAAAVQPAAN